MFGGHGVYHQDIMFALVHGGDLYLKTDAESVGEFTRHSLPPFEFRRGDKLMQTSYYRAPADVMEDPAEAAKWARRSFEAALRAKAAPKKRKRR
jgi:DNA transformation protein and related proteins